MKTQLRFLKFAVMGALIVGASTARAQGGMPDLSDFAGAIAGVAEKAPPAKAAPAPKGGFSSGLTVPRVRPGEGARAIGHELRVKVEAKGGPQPALKALEDAMPHALSDLEAQFQKLGFAPRDMGNAYAYAFLDLHDNAVGAETPQAASLVAARTLSTAVAKVWGPKFKTLSPAAKEQMYESLIMSTTLNTALTQQFAKAGKTKEAAAMRQTSAQLFQTLVGVPPTQVEIGPDGQLSGLTKDKPADAPASDAPPMNAPAQR